MFAEKPSFKILATGFVIKSVPFALVMYLLLDSWPRAIGCGLSVGVFGTAMTYWLSGRGEEKGENEDSRVDSTG